MKSKYNLNLEDNFNNKAEHKTNYLNKKRKRQKIKKKKIVYDSFTFKHLFTNIKNMSVQTLTENIIIKKSNEILELKGILKKLCSQWIRTYDFNYYEKHFKADIYYNKELKQLTIQNEQQKEIYNYVYYKHKGLEELIKIQEEDLNTLNDGRFLNDTIIYFYLE